MSRLELVCSGVEAWLRGEAPYQFAKFDAMYGNELQTRRNFIAETEIAEKWHRNRVLRRGEALNIANQQLLKVCAASRAVIVYDECMNNRNRWYASEATFAEINEHFSTLEADRLPPPSVLLEDFDTVFKDQEPHPLFKRAGELAVVGVLDLSQSSGHIEIPTPGLPSGRLS